LKFIALRGGTRHPIHISSINLSKNLEVSQQSASRYLIELVEKGYLERRLAQGGQIVTVLNKGITVLRKEFSEYSLIFGTQKEIEMKGILETGLGEGGYYISKKGYMRQFQEKLKWKPYEGTFNLRLHDDEVPKIEAMKAAEGILIEGFEQEGRTFGKAWVFKCSLENGGEIVKECAIISPKRTHYRRVVEVISPIFLRDKLKAVDGDVFTTKVDLGDV
jgi:riboflavin kinase